MVTTRAPVNGSVGVGAGVGADVVIGDGDTDSGAADEDAGWLGVVEPQLAIMKMLASRNPWRCWTRRVLLIAVMSPP